MSYIEREAVIRLIKTEGLNEKYDLGDSKDNAWFCEEVNRIPAADVVAVVRCKDCIQFVKYMIAEGGLCGITGDYTPEDFYCADGERKGGTS